MLQIETLTVATKDAVAKLTGLCVDSEKQISVLEAENKGLRNLKFQVLFIMVSYKYPSTLLLL